MDKARNPLRSSISVECIHLCEIDNLFALTPTPLPSLEEGLKSLIHIILLLAQNWGAGG
jgi:hypothetical protein